MSPHLTSPFGSSLEHGQNLSNYSNMFSSVKISTFHPGQSPFYFQSDLYRGNHGRCHREEPKIHLKSYFLWHKNLPLLRQGELQHSQVRLLSADTSPLCPPQINASKTLQWKVKRHWAKCAEHAGLWKYCNTLNIMKAPSHTRRQHWLSNKNIWHCFQLWGNRPFKNNSNNNNPGKTGSSWD